MIKLKAPRTRRTTTVIATVAILATFIAAVYLYVKKDRQLALGQVQLTRVIFETYDHQLGDIGNLHVDNKTFAGMINDQYGYNATGYFADTVDYMIAIAKLSAESKAGARTREIQAYVASHPASDGQGLRLYEFRQLLVLENCLQRPRLASGELQSILKKGKAQHKAAFHETKLSDRERFIQAHKAIFAMCDEMEKAL